MDPDITFTLSSSRPARAALVTLSFTFLETSSGFDRGSQWWVDRVERISRFVVPASGGLAVLLSGALGLTIAGVVSMEAFSLVVPVCMLVLWSMGDWRSPSERAAMIRANEAPERSLSRPRLGS